MSADTSLSIGPSGHGQCLLLSNGRVAIGDLREMWTQCGCVYTHWQRKQKSKSKTKLILFPTFTSLSNHYLISA